MELNSSFYQIYLNYYKFQEVLNIIWIVQINPKEKRKRLLCLMGHICLAQATMDWQPIPKLGERSPWHAAMTTLADFGLPPVGGT
jgi:hypothetical protein